MTDDSEAVGLAARHLLPVQPGCAAPGTPRLRPALSVTVLLASMPLLLPLLAGCAGRDAPPAPTVAAATATAPYVIGPGDRLSVFVYEQPSLTTSDVPVRPDGRISIPLAEDVTAAGRTPAELSDALQDRLKKYVRDPNVTVMVHDFVGPFDRQIRVIGEAADPTALPYRAHMTLLDVMIATKGLTRYAAGNSALVIRRGPNGPEKLHVHLSDLIRDGDIAQNIEMQPGDTLIIPQSWF